MFYATWRESKRSQSVLGLIFAFALFLNLFLPSVAGATTVWEGTDMGRIIDENFYNTDFGRAADVYGDYWAITAPGFKTVYVLQKSGDTWNVAAKLTPSDGESAEGYGQSVAIHGNTIVVGATQLGRQGAVYIYESGGNWSDMTETYKISGQPPVYTIMAGSVSYFNDWGDYFGYAVDIYNDTVVVGAHASNINQGLVYVYQKPADGWASGTAVPVVLSPSATGFSETYAMFGRGVALNSNYLLATSLSYTGAYGPHPANGFLFAYDLPISTSSIPRVLRSSDQNPGDGFGASLDLTESGTAVVGATSASSENGQNGGAAYVFEAPWNDGNVEMAKLTGSTSRRDDNFGAAVSIIDDRILVGAPRNDIVYEFNPNATTITPGRVGPNFLNDEQGAAYVFVRNGNWQTGIENFEITGPRNQRLYFGSQVEQLGNDMLVLHGGGFNNAVQQGLFSFDFNDYENLKPVAEFVSQPVQAEGDSGYVNVGVLLSNTANMPMEMAVDYSFDGISWYAADVWNLVTSSAGSLHPLGPSQVTDITETAGGNFISFSWDTRYSSARYQNFDDSVFADNDVYLRVRYGIDRVSTAEPYLYSGAGLVSNQFHIHNDFSALQSPGPITLAPATSSMLVSWPRFRGAGYFVSSTATAEPVRVEVETSTTTNNLSSNTRYSFQVASYSGATGAVTPYSAVASAYTLANAPSNLTATVNGQTQITLNWSGDASEYYADNGGSNSGWISAAIYAFTGLTCATDYNFSIKGRNGDQVETAMVTTTARTADCGSGDSGSGNSGSGNGGGSSVVIPTIVSIALAESGPISTTTVHVNSDVANATEMMVSENSDFTGATWQTYATNTPYVLSAGNGQKTVYVKYRSASLGVSETRNLTIVLANLGGQDNPGQSGQGNSQNNNSGNSSNTTTTTIETPPIVVAPSVPLTAGIKIVGNSTASQTGAVNSTGSASAKPLEIQLSTTSDNNNLIPTAQAGTNVGFGSKARGYFTRVFNSENNWVIALAAILAVVIIIVGWFVYKWKKDNKNTDNPIAEVKKEEKDGADQK